MKRPPLFSAEEYSRRISQARAAMSQARLDVMVVSDPANIAWLTGLDGWTFHAHQAAIVTGDGPPLWWGPQSCATAARATTWMMDDRILAYPDLQPVGGGHPFTELADRLAQAGFRTARIGVELDSPYFTAACIGAMLAHATGATYHDATTLLNWRRVVKSEPEIALMRQAARIVERAHARAADVAAAGLPTSRLIAETMSALVDGASDAGGAFGGEAPATPPLAAAGAEAGASRLTGSDRPLAPGETITLNIAGRRLGYHCPQARTLCVGEPPAAARQLEAAALRALDAAIGASQPGSTAGAVYAAYVGGLGGAGAPAQIGGSVGLAQAPDWSERSLRLVAGDETELLPGMTLEVGAPLWDGAAGVAISETVLITPQGPEPLSQAPRGIAVCG